MKKKSTFANPLWIVAIILIGFAAMKLATRSTSDGGVIPAAERKVAGDLVWPLADGQTWKLSDQRGKVVLVNYFATWCPPCVREVPDIVKAGNDFGPKGLSMLWVSLDQDEKPVAPFTARNHMQEPISMGAGDPKAALFETIPVTHLYDRQGRLARIYNGMLDESSLRADLQKLITEAP